MARCGDVLYVSFDGVQSHNFGSTEKSYRGEICAGMFYVTMYTKSRSRACSYDPACRDVSLAGQIFLDFTSLPLRVVVFHISQRVRFSHATQLFSTLRSICDYSKKHCFSNIFDNFIQYQHKTR